MRVRGIVVVIWTNGAKEWREKEKGKEKEKRKE